MKWMLAGLISAVLLLGLMGCGKKETADEPNKAEPPPRITSTRSIIFAGICSKPYTPVRALKIGRLSTKIWV